MLNNPQASYVQRGEAIDYTNTGVEDIKGNDVVDLDTRIGIAGGGIPIGATGSAHVIGVQMYLLLTRKLLQLAKRFIGMELLYHLLTQAHQQAVVQTKALAATVARVKIG
ncbi:DUF2190 family protein [Anaerobacillus sp. HL2]|nr:DUF2190 family protein [Anaerobacillus sp. HL2]